MLGAHVLRGEGSHSGPGPAASCEALLFSVIFLLEIFPLKTRLLVAVLRLTTEAVSGGLFFSFSLASQAFSDFLPFFLPADISKTQGGPWL